MSWSTLQWPKAIGSGASRMSKMVLTRMLSTCLQHVMKMQSKRVALRCMRLTKDVGMHSCMEKMVKGPSRFWKPLLLAVGAPKSPKA
eukprot:6474153-Amphidinium_carterae.1